MVELQYSKLLSLGANFPNFFKWSHNSQKFILICCMKFYYGLLVDLGVTIIFLIIYYNLLCPCNALQLQLLILKS